MRSREGALQFSGPSDLAAGGGGGGGVNGIQVGSHKPNFSLFTLDLYPTFPRLN